MNRLLIRCVLCLTSILGIVSLSAKVSTPSIFGDHMVLQRNHDNPVWGWADAGEKVTVSIGGQAHTTKADRDGNWKVTLKPLPAGGPHRLTIKGKNTITYDDVLVGEVWICSGQSNMAWPVQNSYDGDLVALTANHPEIRLISVPQVGTQEPQKDFDGEWTHAAPDTVKDFSAVGYRFGLQLHQALGVPVGLIDNAWGGSAAEAWIRRDVLRKDKRYSELLGRWKETEATYDHAKAVADYESKIAKWKKG